MKKTKILFIYHRMAIGGSTTSLLSILYNLDSTKYDVDLLLYENKGPFLNDIPSYVNIIQPAKKKNKFTKIKLLFNIHFYKAIFSKIFKRNSLVSMQHMSYARLALCRKIEGVYDVAIGFLECWPSYFLLSNKVKAKKRIAWIHTDYEKAKFEAKVDKKILKKADNIVLVSQGCLDSFNRLFDNLKNKTLIVENIFSKNMLEHKANAYKPNIIQKDIKFVVVCRMDIKVKGLDRLLNVFRRLIKEGFNNFSCSFVGSDDSGSFVNLLNEYKDLSQNIHYYGPTINPYPYFVAANYCLLLSRFEGKPMVITESQLLGVPTIITNYNSAHEQVVDNYDGLILENNEESIYQGLKKVLLNKELYDIYVKNLKNKDFSYCITTNEIVKLIDSN